MSTVVFAQYESSHPAKCIQPKVLMLAFPIHLSKNSIK